MYERNHQTKQYGESLYRDHLFQELAYCIELIHFSDISVTGSYREAERMLVCMSLIFGHTKCYQMLKGPGTKNSLVPLKRSRL